MLHIQHERKDFNLCAEWFDVIGWCGAAMANAETGWGKLQG
jgi:hypothetical protein